MTDPSTLDFDVLRTEGIALLQRLCGQLWTDYNLHDPGVTILEQLVYGLTDMAYRTGFDVADHLAGPDGRIDYRRQAMYAPEAILCSAPLTIEDYRRLLYDAVPVLDDIWIRHTGNGLLEIDVMRMREAADAEAAANAATDALEQSVRAVYAAHRTLGEDLARVRQLEPRPYYLEGVIETDGDANPADILARALFDCGQYLASGMTMARLRDVLASGAAPDQVFNGPGMRHGRVSVRRDPPGVRTVTISELIGQIQRIPGVRRVRQLILVDAHKNRCRDQQVVCDSTQGAYPVLPFPGPAQRGWLRVKAAQGIEYGASEQVSAEPSWTPAGNLLHEEARLALQKLRFEQRAFRKVRVNGEDSYPLPLGKRRELRAYVSIQEEFPDVYGINRYGLPHSAAPERAAQARQLKAYLYPFEQLMANYLENLQSLPALFSAAPAVPAASYSSQALDNGNIARIEALYLDAPPERHEKLRAAMAAQDDVFERKSRVYDYLLAIYGESFPQARLRRFNQYHAGRATDGWLLEAKARLIRELAELGAARAGGFDYASAGTRQVATLQQRVAILLGCDSIALGQSLLPRQDGVVLQLEETPGPAGLPAAPPPGWSAVPPLPTDAPRGEVARLPRGGMPIALFRDGAMLSNYCLVRQDGDTFLYCRAGASWWRVHRHAQRDAVVRMAHALGAALAEANRRSEGLHLVEHVLLRPRTGEANAGGAGFDPAFHAARLTVVMPGWTVRCADRDFRNFAEETVREHCPAHLHPGFLWLGPAAMAEFEALHDAWRAALQDWHGGDAAFLDAAGDALAGYLRAQYGTQA